MSEKGKEARALFENGYNCAQALLGAFCKEAGLSFNDAVRISSPFGGGMGRMRETCGAVSGMFMAAGMILGYEDPGNNGERARTYAMTQELANRFKTENGSIICRELLGLVPMSNDPMPEKRTKDYYKKRPCPELVEQAANILSAYLESFSKG